MVLVMSYVGVSMEQITKMTFILYIHLLVSMVLQITALCSPHTPALDGGRMDQTTEILLSTTAAPYDDLSQCELTVDQKRNITWIKAKSGECVASVPFCLNPKMELVRRCCYHGLWDPEPSCDYISPYPPPCPEGYLYHESTWSCYTFTGKTQFPPVCNNNDVANFSIYKIILDEIAHEPVWMPVTRDRTHGTGFYVWTELSANYKSYFSYDSENAIHDWENDCFVYVNSTTISESCKKYYRGLCAYHRISGDENYCSQKSNNCQPQHYQNQTKCFCIDDFEPGGNNLLQRAELLDPFQNNIISSLTSDKCLIGLERRDEGFVWARSNITISYAYWTLSTNFSIENKYALSSSEGWILQNNSDAECLVHEVIVRKADPKLHLFYNHRSKLFELSIENEEDLKKFDADRNLPAYCFTDASDVTEIIYRYTSYGYIGENFTFAPVKKGPGHYWCEAVRYSDFEIIQSETILFEPENIYGCEYVGIIVFNYLFPTPDAVKSVQIIFQSSLSDYYIRVFKMISFDNVRKEIEFNVHFTQKKRKGDCIKEFHQLKLELIKVCIEYNNLLVFIYTKDLYSRSFCVGETDSDDLQWPDTPIGSTVFPKQPCLSKNGSLITRKCTGNFTYGARWLPPSEHCKTSCKQDVHKELYSLFTSNISIPQLVEGLVKITTSVTYDEFGPFDIYLYSLIFDKVIQETSVYLPELLNITSMMNNFNRYTLAKAQTDFNATDKLLASLDSMFSDLNLSIFHPTMNLHTNNILLKAVDISIQNVAGVILYKNRSLYSLEFFHDGSPLSDLVQGDHFQGAVSIPAALRNQIIRSKNSSVTFVVYIKDSLFNSPSSNQNRRVEVSQIFDVLIPGFTQDFVEPISIFYKDNILDAEKPCVHWNFQSTKSYWKRDNNSVDTKAGVKCTFWHITHFALLFIDNEDLLVWGNALDLITDVNCLLSFIGFFFIFLTAILFKQWRSQVGNQILLNFVLAIALQICLLYTSDLVHRLSEMSKLCTTVGAMLHYSIISEFGWMLIVAILQFKRFVEVLGGQPKYIMLKACVVGWILPLFPMLCILFLDPKSYVRNKVGLCYPTGLSLYLSIWLPVGTIVAINSVIFIYIINSVTKNNIERTTDNKEARYQWRLAVLLFFMLGLTWTFGLLIEANFGSLFVYLFTFAATLQGFVIFLFFIIFNGRTRLMYVQFVRNRFCLDKLV